MRHLVVQKKVMKSGVLFHDSSLHSATRQKRAKPPLRPCPSIVFHLRVLSVCVFLRSRLGFSRQLFAIALWRQRAAHESVITWYQAFIAFVFLHKFCANVTQISIIANIMRRNCDIYRQYVYFIQLSAALHNFVTATKPDPILYIYNVSHHFPLRHGAMARNAR